MPQGHCMCGAVTVSVDKLADETIYCHCDNCKRQSGAGGTWVTMAQKDQVSIDGPLQKYMDDKTDSGTAMERWFCGRCGCPVYSQTPLLEGQIVLKMGLFDQVPNVTQEWYCKNKQSWEPTVDGASTAEITPS